MTKQELAKQKKLPVIAGNIQLYNALHPKVAKIQAKFLKDSGIKLKFGKITEEEIRELFKSWYPDYKAFKFDWRKVIELYNRAVNCRFKF